MARAFASAFVRGKKAMAIAVLSGALVLASACGAASTGNDTTSNDTTSSSSSAAAGSTSAESSSTSAESSSTSADAGSDAVCTGKKVVFVTVQKTGDKGVVDNMVDGLNRVKSELGAENVQVVQALDPAQYSTTLKQAGAKNDIVVANFQPITDALKKAAVDNPSVRYVHIYGSAESDETTPNLSAVQYPFEEATYLAGVFAAGFTSTGVLGFEAGQYDGGINADYHAYVKGAQSVRSDIKVEVAEVGSFSDDGLAKSVVSALISRGADVIQADGPQNGAIAAAKEAGKYVLVTSEGLAPSAPDVIPGITYLKFGDSLFAEVEKACGSDFVGTNVSSGVKDGFIGFQLSEAFLAAAPAELATKAKDSFEKVKAATEAIKSGAIVVEHDTSKP